jgi:hypothetical protein
MQFNQFIQFAGNFFLVFAPPVKPVAGFDNEPEKKVNT